MKLMLQVAGGILLAVVVVWGALVGMQQYKVHEVNHRQELAVSTAKRTDIFRDVRCKTREEGEIEVGKNFLIAKREYVDDFLLSAFLMCKRENAFIDHFLLWDAEVGASVGTHSLLGLHLEENASPGNP